MAVSAEDGDLLENEWTYVLKELPQMISQVPFSTWDPSEKFNWLVAHFYVLYTKEKIDAHDVMDLNEHKIHFSPPRSKTLLTKPSGTHPNVDELSPTSVPKQHKVHQSSATEIHQTEEQHFEDDHDIIFTSPPLNFNQKISLLNPTTISSGLLANLAVVILHEFLPLPTLSALVIIINVMFFEYWIWFKEASSKPQFAQIKETRKKRSQVTYANKHIDSTSTLPSPNKTIGDLTVDVEKEVSPTPKRRETVAQVSKKIVPGTTLVKIGSDRHEKGEKNWGEWTWVSGDSVLVRDGPDYATNRKKSPSAEALYETAAVDVYAIPKKVWQIGRFFDLNSLGGESKEGWINGLPEYIIFNVLCPGYAPGVFAPVTDGEGFITTIFLKMTSRTRQLLENKQESPAINLLRRFVEESELSSDMRGRLKVIARVSNLEELDFNRVVGGFVQRYNATPFLVRDKEAEYFKGDNYFEIDVDMHLFSNLTRNAFFHLKHILQLMRAHFAFVIEGRSDDELPEQLVSITEVFNVQNLSAPALPIDVEE